jgi:hypothetical protein
MHHTSRQLPLALAPPAVKWELPVRRRRCARQPPSIEHAGAHAVSGRGLIGSAVGQNQDGTHCPVW